jgi:hypothetical protein
MADEAPWAGTIGSSARLNNMTNIKNTGATLSGLDKSKFGILICTSTGSGFIVNHVYLCTADGLSVIDISQIASHTHTGSADGGTLNDVLMNTPEMLDIYLLSAGELLKANFIQTVTGTGTIEDNTDGSNIRNIRCRPNATSGSGATIACPHNLVQDWVKTQSCAFVCQFETATNLAYHGGVGADDVTAADSNTRKIQAEVCTVTNNNWWLRTANGTANSASDMGVAITTNKDAVRLVNLPGLGTPETDIEINALNLLQKTSNIPLDSIVTASAGIFKHSVKNSTGADRPAKFYGARLSFITGSQWAYG